MISKKERHTLSGTETDRNRPESPPSAERIAEELRGVKSMGDFFGRQGMFACLFARTLEEMLETELPQHLAYEQYAPDVVATPGSAAPWLLSLAPQSLCSLRGRSMH